MTTRYLGDEPCTSPSQVVRYLTDNYTDAAGPISEDAAQAVVDAEREQIMKGITVFRSNVYYIGDEAVKNAGVGWTEIDEPEYDDGDEDDDGGEAY